MPYGSKVAAERRFAYRTPALERLVLDTADFRRNPLNLLWPLEPPVIKRAMASADGGQQGPGGSQLAVPDGAQVPGGGQEMPQDAFDPLPHDGGQKNQADVNWQYPMVHKYQAETKKCLNA